MRRLSANGLRGTCWIVGRLAKSVSGAAAVEFAIVSVPFIALLVAIIQTFLVFFAGEQLEMIVNSASRSILTGQAQKTSMTQAQFANLVCGFATVLFNCASLMIDVEAYDSFSAANATPPTLTFNAQGQVTNNWQFQPGTSNQIVVVRVMYQWPVFLGPLGFSLANLSNGNRLLIASSAFKNEPYQ
jgi:Flp pilus assembly protein TadG